MKTLGSSVISQAESEDEIIAGTHEAMLVENGIGNRRS